MLFRSAGSVTATSVTVADLNDAPVNITEILLDTDDTGPGTAGIQIRCHVFNADPTANSGVVGGDNAAYSNKRNGWIGSFSGTMRAFSDGSKGVLVPDEGTLRIAQAESPLRPGSARVIKTCNHQCELEIQLKSRGWDAADFSRVEFVSDYEVNGLRNHYHNFGLGVPLIAVRKPHDDPDPAAGVGSNADPLALRPVGDGEHDRTREDRQHVRSGPDVHRRRLLPEPHRSGGPA